MILFCDSVILTKWHSVKNGVSLKVIITNITHWSLPPLRDERRKKKWQNQVSRKRAHLKMHFKNEAAASSSPWPKCAGFPEDIGFERVPSLPRAPELLQDTAAGDFGPSRCGRAGSPILPWDGAAPRPHGTLRFLRQAAAPLPASLLVLPLRRRACAHKLTNCRYNIK